MTGCIDIMPDKLTTFLQIDRPIVIQGLILKKGEGMGISCSWNIDREGSTTTIEEIQFDGKTDRFFRDKSNLNFDHLPGNTQITTTEIGNSQINIWKLLGYCMF